MIIEVEETETYKKWFNKLTDLFAKSRIDMRIQRVRKGNFGDCEPVGGSVFELRIHAGAGYRVYFKKSGERIILLLCGGDKSTQQSDIKKAKEMAKDI